MAEDHRQSEAAAAERISPTNTANKSRPAAFYFTQGRIYHSTNRRQNACYLPGKQGVKRKRQAGHSGPNTERASNAPMAHNALVGNLSQALLNAQGRRRFQLRRIDKKIICPPNGTFVHPTELLSTDRRNFCPLMHGNFVHS